MNSRAPHPAHRRAVRRLAALLLPAGLAACDGPGTAPAIPFLGAFFPSWLLSAFVGIAGAVVVRVIFVRIGLDDVLPARLIVYVAVAALIGFFVSGIAFGR